MEKTAKILHVCPYLKGSHAYFANSLTKYSRFQFETLGFERLNWKWSSICSPLLSCQDQGPPDLILFTDFCNVPGFFAVHSKLRGCKSLLYMHENQLTYPLHPDQKTTDPNYGWQTLLSISWADEVWFNSEWHLRDFSQGLKSFESNLPVSASFGEELLNKARVVYPGIDCPQVSKSAEVSRNGEPLTVVWNHRSDYDKGIKKLMRLVQRLKIEQIPINWIHLGEVPQKHVSALSELFSGITGELIHFGFCESKMQYYKFLELADIVISLSDHEFFGISVLEAISMNCFPLLPKALSYPELVPKALHSDVFYKNQNDLYNRIKYFAASPDKIRIPPSDKNILLKGSVQKFQMSERINEIDFELARLMDV